MSGDDADSRRGQERLRILDEAGERIGTTLDVMRTGQELADLAVPTLADYATVDLAESVLLGEEPPARPGSEGGERTPPSAAPGSPRSGPERRSRCSPAVIRSPPHRHRRSPASCAPAGPTWSPC